MGEARPTVGTLRALTLSGLLSTWKPHAVAPGGPPEGHHGRSMDVEEQRMKLHAVAPGGPPEGQCKKEMVYSNKPTSDR